MRASGLFLLLAVATLASGQSPEEEEYKRKLKDYEEKKAVYDRHQAIANVPVKASNDLVSKLPADQIPPGYAEQLLPTYTGIPVQFHSIGDPIVVPEPVPEAQTIAPPVQGQSAVRATPLQPGPQPFADRKPASSNVSVKTTIQSPALVRRPVAAVAPVVRAANRPPGLLLFTNARLSLPSLAQRFGYGAAPVPTRVQVEAYRNAPARSP